MYRNVQSSLLVCPKNESRFRLRIAIRLLVPLHVPLHGNVHILTWMFPIQIGTTRMGSSIISLKVPNYGVFISLEIDFTLTNGAGPGEVSHVHLGLHCLLKYSFTIYSGGSTGGSLEPSPPHVYKNPMKLNHLFNILYEK